MLLQTEHSRTFSFASRIASERASACSLSARKRKNASRCAVFCPMPGSRRSSSINRVTEGAKSGMEYIPPGEFHFMKVKQEGNKKRLQAIRIGGIHPN